MYVNVSRYLPTRLATDRKNDRDLSQLLKMNTFITGQTFRGKSLLHASGSLPMQTPAAIHLQAFAMPQHSWMFLLQGTNIGLPC